MKPTTLLVAGLLLSSSLSSAAQAQTPSSSSSSSSEAPAEVRYQARSVVVFTGATVDGTVKGPAGFRIHQRKKVGFRSMIELRSDFRDALSTSPAAL